MYRIRFQTRAILLAIGLAAPLTPAASSPLLGDLDALVLGGASDAFEADGFDAASPPDALPLTGEALIATGTASAFVDAGASTGSLIIEVSVLGEAVADATADLGAVLAGGPAGGTFRLDVLLDYTTLGLPSLEVDAVTDLFFSVLADGDLLVSEALTLGADPVLDVFSYVFDLPAGIDAGLGITLATSVLGASDLAFGGTLALVDFSVSGVPEPPAIGLLAAGLAALGFQVRRRPTG